MRQSPRPLFAGTKSARPTPTEIQERMGAATMAKAGELLTQLELAAQDAEAYCARALEAVRAVAAPGGKVDRKKIDGEQHLVHGLGWVATYAEALRQISDWARRLTDDGKFRRSDR